MGLSFGEAHATRDGDSCFRRSFDDSVRLYFSLVYSGRFYSRHSVSRGASCGLDFFLRPKSTTPVVTSSQSATCKLKVGGWRQKR